MALTKENAGKFLPIVQAMADGKTVEFNNGSGWCKCDALALCERPERYRVAPEPKLRPWTIKEVPVGALIRVIGDSENRHLIMGSSANWWVYYGDQATTPCVIANGYEHSLDLGKTWLPCGVME